MATTMGGTIVTVAEADLDESAVDFAVTVTCAGLGMVFGAVYSPVEVMVPHALAEHPAPATLHVTLVVVLPVTEAVNCC
jgi:hypothetical protein